MSTAYFSYEVSEQLGAYVYRLIDPRDGETFYVGKGRGNRVFRHALEADIGVEDDVGTMSTKLDLIREIKAHGETVRYVIHRHGLTDEVAFEVEAALIDAYPKLSNLVSGHHASVKGLATVDEILYRYNLPIFEPEPAHRLLVITINKLRGRRDKKVIHDLVRYCWPLGMGRAKTVDYVLAADRGVIVGAFKPNRWQPAIATDFAYIDPNYADEPNRVAFHGEWAEPEIVDLYVGTHGKRMSLDVFKPSRNACRYINC